MRRSAPLALAALAGVVACGKSAETRTPPAIAMVSPDHGPSIGGATITLTGSGLAGSDDMPIVVVGDHAATVVTATDTMVTFTLPPGPQQTTVDVTVSDAHGFAIAGSAFTYNPLPIVLAVSPSGGPAAGGTAITVTGRGFSNFEAGTTTIAIGGGTATNVQVTDDTTLTAVTGSTAAGTPAFTPLDVQLANANGSAVLAAAYSTTKQGLLLISRNDSSLTFIDPVTKDSIGIATLTTRLHGCALGSDGTLYSEGRNPATGIMSLFTFDPLSGAATFLGENRDSVSNANYAVSSLAFQDGVLYGYVDAPCCSAPERLVRIQVSGGSGAGSGSGSAVTPGSGAATLIGSGSVSSFRGQSIGTCNPTTVFYAETTSGTLDTLDLADSTRKPGPVMSGGNGARVRGLLLVGQTLYVLEQGSPSTLYTVNTISGVLTTVSTVVDQAAALCQTPPSF